MPGAAVGWAAVGWVAVGAVTSELARRSELAAQ